MINAIFDVMRISICSLLDCFISPNKLPARPWLTEYTFRLAKRTLHESKNKPIPWLRDRQKLLKMYAPFMFKTTRENEIIAGVACVTYRPSHIPSPDVIVVYLHGGGYVVGSADGYSLTLANVALKTHAIVVGIEYRLAPEHPLPAAQSDCLAVTESILANPLYEGKKVILMGDSAGGGLCLSVIHHLSHQANIRQPDACVLLSPWLAPLDKDGLTLENEDTDILDKSLLDRWVSEFVSDENSDGPLVDFRNINLTTLPPLYIQAAGAEVFLKQITAFVKRLNDEGVEHYIDVFEQQFHVFQTFSPLVKQADEAIEKIAHYIHSL